MSAQALSRHDKHYDTCECGRRKRVTSERCRSCIGRALFKPELRVCPDCGRWKSPNATRCQDCDRRRRYPNAKRRRICPDCGGPKWETSERCAKCSGTQQRHPNQRQLDAGVLQELVRKHMRSVGAETLNAVELSAFLDAVWPGEPRMANRRLRSFMQQRFVTFDVADRILCALDCEWLWHADPVLNEAYERVSLD